MVQLLSSVINFYLSSHKGLPRTCYKGILFNFIESTLAGIFYFFSMYFVDVLHINISIASIIISFYGLGTIIGGLIGGKLSDKISPSTISSFSLMIQAIAILNLVIIRTSLLLTVDLFILGLATYGFITSNYVWVLSHCKKLAEDRLKAINSMAVASNLGIGVAAIAIGGLVHYSFNYVFFLSGFLLLLLSIFLFFQKRDKNFIHDVEQYFIDSNNNINDINVIKLNHNKTTINLVLICLFFTGMIVSQLSTTYSIFLKNQFPSIGIYAFSSLFFLNTILVIIFQNHIVNYFSKANKIIMIGIGSFFIGVGMCILNFSFTFSITLLSCLTYSFGEMIFFSMVQLYLYQNGQEGRKGNALGNYRMVYASSRFLGPTLGGLIYYYISASALWYLSGLIGLIFLITCYRYKSFSISEVLT